MCLLCVYVRTGIADEEVESLAGEKEGCDDDVEFVSVMRPANSVSDTHTHTHTHSRTCLEQSQ